MSEPSRTTAERAAEAGWFRRLLRRPEIVRVEPVHSVRLPVGRVRIEVEVSGWGWLIVARRAYFFRGPESLRFLVPLGRTLKAVVLSPLGWASRSVVAGATLDIGPAPPRAPRAAGGLLTVRVREHGRRRPGSIAPVLSVTPEPRVPHFKPQVPTCRPRVRFAAEPFVRPAHVRDRTLAVSMPPLERTRLLPPRLPPLPKTLIEEGVEP